MADQQEPHLLQQVEEPKIFDFLIRGELVRGSVERMLLEMGISTETSVEVEYVLAVPPPKDSAAHKQDDWLSDLSSFETDGTRFVVASLYDGCITMHKVDGCEDVTMQSKKKVSDGQVNAISPCHRKDGVPQGYLAATNDSDVKLLRFSMEHNDCFEHVLVYKGHTDSVECLSVAPDDSRFVSGGWDNTICLWESASPANFFNSASGSKRQKTRGSSEDVEASEPLLKLTEHTQCVSTLDWVTANTVFSGSWDHHVKCWDVASTKVLASYHSPHPVYAVSAETGKDTPCVAIGGGDNVVRLWDTRERQGEQSASIKLMAAAHEGWITTVRWCPMTDYHFLSGSVDGHIKLWDIRAKVPLATVSTHTGKAFCASWLGKNFVASGGEDAMLRVAELVI